MSDRPLLRVVKGDPTPEELAALVAVLTARAGADEDAGARPQSHADLAYGLRKPMRVGPGAWVASGWVAGTRTKASL
jgi:hypothetical protein